MKPETITTGQITIRFLLEGADTGGSMAMFEFAVPAGAKVPIPHYHEAYDETIYGLEGMLRFTIDGKVTDLGAGDTAFIPRGVVHGFINPGETDAKALAVITPGILGSDFFKDIAEIVNAAGPPDLAKLKAVMLKHGLVPVMP